MLRWFLGILIITWIFTIGMRVGEMKAGMEGRYGYSHRAMPMMYGAQGGWEEGNVTFTTSAGPMGATGVKGGTVQIIKSN